MSYQSNDRGSRENSRDDARDGKKPAGPMRRQFFRRRKTCPFSGQNALPIDYKDVRILLKFVSERGKIIPSRISAVSMKKQRQLAIAIKRARFLSLMPYVND